MRVLIIYAHPNPNSFNHALVQHCQQGLIAGGHEVRIKDLYAENFDPVLRAEHLAELQTGQIPAKIQAEQEALLWAEGLVFIYPLWWFGRPAILKGWFDHVLTRGVAYDYSSEGVTGLLKHQKALVLITAGGSKEFFQEQNAETLIHRPMTDGTLAYCGVTNIEQHIYYNVPMMSDAERQGILAQVQAMSESF